MRHCTLHSAKPFYFFGLAASLCSILSCGTGTDQKSQPPVIDTLSKEKTALAKENNCDSNNTIGLRKKFYDLREWNQQRKDFDAHVKVDLADSAVDIKDPVLRIPWASIVRAQKSVEIAGKPVRGIYFGYGLDGDKFHPIIEFMYPDPDNGDLLVFDQAPFSFDGKVLKPESDPKKYTDAYLRNARLDRFGNGLTRLNETAGDLDPLASWFQYADNVNNLLAQNSVKDTVLVVSCVSKDLCYGSMAMAAAVSEYRHLLTLHVADGAVDKLSDANLEATKPYMDRALDMGGLCPPKCPHGKP